MKDPTTYGENIGFYTVVQAGIAGVSSLTFLTIVGFLIKLAHDIDSIANGGGGLFRYVMQKYTSVILNFLFMDTIPTIGNFMYLSMI